LFHTYSEAKRHADGLMKDLAKGSQVTALNPAQARDALAALERLADFHRATGCRVSLLAGISEFVEAAGKLCWHTMGETVEGYLALLTNVTPIICCPVGTEGSWPLNPGIIWAVPLWSAVRYASARKFSRR